MTSMFFRNVAVFVMGLSVAAVAPQPAAANLLTNPGFETGDTTGWTADPLAYATGLPGFVHDGSFGAALDSAVTQPGSNVILDQSVVLPNAGTYAFGGWVRAFTVAPSVEAPDADFDQISISTFVAATAEGDTLISTVEAFPNFQAVGGPGSLARASDWVFFSGLFDYTGAGGDTVLFRFYLQNAGSALVSVAAGDSFFLEPVGVEVPEPTTLALLGFCLAGLALMRRRRPA